MKRVVGFLLGASLGVAAAFLLRRLWNNQNALPAPESAPTPAPAPEKTVEAVTEEAVRPGIKFKVRTTGPRPEGGGNGTEKAPSPNGAVTRNTEPPAATETDVSAVSPRSETFESAIPQSSVTTPEETGTGAENETGTGESLTDFTVIRGIGEVFNGKLHEAGITSFEQLAALSPEEIAEKTGIPQDRIERDQWHDQLKELTGNEQNKRE